MKKGIFILSLACLTALPAHADDLSDHLGLFANAKEVFRPLLADPREVQLAVRLVTPVGHKNLGEALLGDYFGLYRWALPWQDSYIQWSVTGGVFARFDLVSPEKDSQVTDYIVGMPLDMRVKKWSLRMLPYHLSSHLGDDYLKRNGGTTVKYTFDAYKTLIAYEPIPSVRLYTGMTYIMRNGQVALGRYETQSGAEWNSAWWGHNHAQTYVATDYQAWERIGWNPILNVQAGVRIANHPEDKQKVAIFTEYGTGHMTFGQFFQKQESHWVLGVRFEIP